MSRIIAEQRKLEERFESLIQQRSLLKKSSNKKKYKENQASLCSPHCSSPGRSAQASRSPPPPRALIAPFPVAQEEIQEVARALKLSTKVLCRNLKDNPNVAENLMKLQSVRHARARQHSAHASTTHRAPAHPRTKRAHERRLATSLFVRA